MTKNPTPIPITAPASLFPISEPRPLPIIIQPTNSGMYLKIWGQNLADDDNQTGAYFTDPSSGQFRNDFYMEPRMYGITFGARF